MAVNVVCERPLKVDQVGLTTWIKGALLGISIDRFLNLNFYDLSKFRDVFLKTFVFCLVFTKIDWFPGIHGTRSKGCPDILGVLAAGL